jgi:hypothetical protein
VHVCAPIPKHSSRPSGVNCPRLARCLMTGGNDSSTAMPIPVPQRWRFRLASSGRRSAWWHSSSPQCASRSAASPPQVLMAVIQLGEQGASRAGLQVTGAQRDESPQSIEALTYRVMRLDAYRPHPICR